jgi:hypothetical protein
VGEEGGILSKDTHKDRENDRDARERERERERESTRAVKSSEEVMMNS